MCDRCLCGKLHPPPAVRASSGTLHLACLSAAHSVSEEGRGGGVDWEAPQKEGGGDRTGRWRNR